MAGGSFAVIFRRPVPAPAQSDLARFEPYYSCLHPPTHLLLAATPPRARAQVTAETAPFLDPLYCAPPLSPPPPLPPRAATEPHGDGTSPTGPPRGSPSHRRLSCFPPGTDIDLEPTSTSDTRSAEGWVRPRPKNDTSEGKKLGLGFNLFYFPFIFSWSGLLDVSNHTTRYR